MFDKNEKPFFFRLDHPTNGTYKTINVRKAVRAVISVKGKFLFVTNIHGDYKTPGGGMAKEEDPFAAVKREVKEETGFDFSPEFLLGTACEKRPDMFQDDAIFIMESRYYFGRIESFLGKQNLDGYEEKLEFRPVILPLEVAIANNKRLIADGEDRNIWVKRETLVFEELLRRKKETKDQT